jgi:radical SAM superfamily enzyme
MKPAHLTEMTYTPVPGTKMYRDIEEGKFEVLDARECLIETRTLVENLAPQQLHFLSNHASNYVSIDAQLPADKEAVLQTLDAAIHEDIPLRSERSRGL